MPACLRIVADAHIWKVRQAFSDLPGFDVDLNVLENSQIRPENVRDADILLTRSATKVNADLLAESKVRFAATATIGDDHYDKAWLDTHGISWANAAGSSTGSVIEYMVAVILKLHMHGHISIPDTSIGIIGVGRIGSQVEKVCRALGMQVLRNDPPKARVETEENFQTLGQLFEEADLLSIHTPLIAEGEDCTRHLLNTFRFKQFQGCGIINAARGACVDNRALLQWLDADTNHFAALDCWEHEPRPDKHLFAHPGMVITTPHIAGHSLDGKAANTLYIYRALCEFLNIEPQWDMHDDLPAPAFAHTITETGDCWQKLHAAVQHLYPLVDDVESMKCWPDLTSSELPNAFTAYRRHYPERRAWQFCPIHFTHADDQLLQLAHAIGIKVV